jgi:hypothetical protein
MRKIEAAHTYHADYFADSGWQFDVAGSPRLTARYLGVTYGVVIARFHRGGLGIQLVAP